MNEQSGLRLTTPSDRELAATRVFEAPRRLVYEAHTRPELVKRWLLGPPGWSMPVCEIDLRVGGSYRYVWRRDADGSEMGMGGVYKEIVPDERLVVSERFDEPWYPGEAEVTTTFVESGGRTTLTLTVRYESREARDAVLRSPMEQGLAAGYDRLQNVVGEIA